MIIIAVDPEHLTNPAYTDFTVYDDDKSEIQVFNPKQTYLYAINVIGGRWPEGEEAISKDPKWAYLYARDVVKERWSEGEEAISKHSEWAYYYIFDVIKGRWPKGEKAINKDPKWAHTQILLDIATMTLYNDHHHT